MDVLFATGKHLHASPVKLIFIESDTPLKFPAQAMFVVPKRQFKKAHDRNKLKRRMKEAYRLHKSTLYSSLAASNKTLVLAFIFVGKKTENYAVISTSLTRLISQLTK